MTPEGLIRLTMRGISMSSGGKRVALYLDKSMLRDGEYLPIIVVESEPRCRGFPADVAETAATWFGRVYRNAQERVNQINEGFGIDEDEVLAMALGAAKAAAGRQSSGDSDS